MQKNKMGLISDILELPVRAGSVLGRDKELEALRQLDSEALPIVIFLYGIPGIGKTVLMNTYLDEAKEGGVFVIRIDANRFEPTALSFIGELARVLKVEADLVVEKLHTITARVVIAIDNYQAMRLLDRWIRDEFLGGMPANVRLLLAANFRPGAAWHTLAPWNSLSKTIELSSLSEKHSVELLLSKNLSLSQAQYVQSIAGGYPMALVMASSILGESNSEDMGESLSSQLMTYLADAYLGSIENKTLVSLLKELALLRRITSSILVVLRPDQNSDQLFQDLRKVPFVKETNEGLMIHDAVRDALVVSLNAENPSRIREVKRQVWSLLAAELKETHDLNLWRFTADTIYLLSDPVIREAFFPRDVPFYDVLPARPEHGDAIKKICEIHESGEQLALMDMWWSEAPQCFKVVLNNFGDVTGFYLAIDPALVKDTLINRDPLTRAWQVHSRQSRLPVSQREFFIRRWLSFDDGDIPSAVQAAAWLDMKQAYLEMWPDLRQVYLAVTDLAPYAEIATRLEFRSLKELSQKFDDKTYFGAVLDMGPASVNGWLHRLLAKELGINSHDFLDPEHQAILINGKTVELTALEFKVAAYLYTNLGNSVSRERLLNNVWGLSYQGGSNVVDAVIANLRRKMGAQANRLQTVRGLGYSLELS